MADSNSKYPLRHVSIRVPWHDSGWAGTICKAPHLNGACAQLKRIAEKKRESEEVPIANTRFDSLERAKWPCCVEERSGFMAPFEMEHEKRHALAAMDKGHYGHFQPTLQRYPAYSAGVIPFRWMMKDNIPLFRESFELDIDETREPPLNYNTSWIHEGQNQKALLDAFDGHLQTEASLCFFYAKHVPFVEGTDRILIGVGRISGKGDLSEYSRKDHAGMRGMIWERPVQHSIRSNGKDGFLIPYHEVLSQAEKDPGLDVLRYAAKAPDEHWDEFSYASELVSHDAAIGALLSIESALGRMEFELGIATETQRQWIHQELIRLWQVRGPYPGLGAVMTAFGLTRGIFVAHAIQQIAGENADPWPVLDAVFENPGAHLPRHLHRDIVELAPTWKKLPRERRAFLRLLSRFELGKDLAANLYETGSRRKKGWGGTDSEILENPYRLYEISRHDREGVPLPTIDRGVFPEDTVRLKHPLDAPSQLDSAIDLRRVRAFTIMALEDAALAGHTLLPKDRITEAIRSKPLQPSCPVTGDILASRAGDMGSELNRIPLDGDFALQLVRYLKMGETVRSEVLGRVSGKRHAVSRDWNALLDSKFGPAADPEEKNARLEKAAALAELASSRISILAGPAGAGKTTVLGLLCTQKEIREDGLLLLAPTGKARVRMQELIGSSQAKALTIAQFLNQHGRYESATGRYLVSERPKETGFGTVIVDECSMLTEDMLGALFDALQGVRRYIFVGDPAQLPPIGAGRPFVDIIAKLRPSNYESLFPRIGPGYAELTIERRQVGSDRPDLTLAKWFSGTTPSPGDDDVFANTEAGHQTLRFVEWKRSEEFQAKLLEVMIQELGLKSAEDMRGFNQTFGSNPKGDYDYFNAGYYGKSGSVGKLEDWQILAPLRGMAFGVSDINSHIHARFRKGFLELAGRQWGRKIPKPMGAERIVYGDKVINLNNHRRDGKRVYPKEGALGYLANGEIGLCVGQWIEDAWTLKVEFSSQKGFTYDFYASDFADEGDAAMELAYALTVHKAQGSQFKLVILVLPENHPILSRELIYTALSRHQDRIVIMHQGVPSLLKNFASPHRSETARRMTNLMHDCRMVEIRMPKGSVFLQEGLIHKSRIGVPVRSKSELIIADALTAAGISFEYEKALTMGGAIRYPDFFIEDEISGQTFIWEHLGLLEKDAYRRKWERKLEWYRSNGILPEPEGGGPNGILITTSESSSAGFDSADIQRAIKIIRKS